MYLLLNWRVSYAGLRFHAHGYETQNIQHYYLDNDKFNKFYESLCIFFVFCELDIRFQ